MFSNVSRVNVQIDPEAGLERWVPQFFCRRIVKELNLMSNSGAAIVHLDRKNKLC